MPNKVCLVGISISIEGQWGDFWLKLYQCGAVLVGVISDRVKGAVYARFCSYQILSVPTFPCKWQSPRMRYADSQRRRPLAPNTFSRRMISTVPRSLCYPFEQKTVRFLYLCSYGVFRPWQSFGKTSRTKANKTYKEGRSKFHNGNT